MRAWRSRHNIRREVSEVMAVAYDSSKEAAAARDLLHREITAFERTAIGASGRLRLGWRPRRLLGMLHRLYDASVTGELPAASELRARLLLIRWRRSRLRGQAMVLGGAWLASHFMWLAGFVSLWPLVIVSALSPAALWLQWSAIRDHAAAVRGVRERRGGGYRPRLLREVKRDG